VTVSGGSGVINCIGGGGGRALLLSALLAVLLDVVGSVDTSGSAAGFEL
jgi:hypothetical protein